MKSPRVLVLLALLAVALSATAQEKSDKFAVFVTGLDEAIGAMAELESSLISERVAAGMRAAEMRGKHLFESWETPEVLSRLQQQSQGQTPPLSASIRANEGVVCLVQGIGVWGAMER